MNRPVLVETSSPLEGAFERYVAQALPANATALQLSEARDSFFAGAYLVANLLQTALREQLPGYAPWMAEQLVGEARTVVAKISGMRHGH